MSYYDEARALLAWAGVPDEEAHRIAERSATVEAELDALLAPEHRERLRREAERLVLGEGS